MQKVPKNVKKALTLLLRKGRKQLNRLIMINITILASGSGSNAENIANYFSASDKFNVTAILSNKKDAYVHQRAEKLGIPHSSFTKADMEDGTLLKTLKELNTDYVILAGFLLKVSDEILENYPMKIINIHPALLPLYGGKGMYGMKVHEAVVANKEKQSGITIHLIDNNYDQGTTIFQATVDVLPTDTPDDVAHKVHELEYKYFPSVIEKYALGEITIK